MTVTQSKLTSNNQPEELRTPRLRNLPTKGVDERIKGDMTSWFNGSRLTVEGIKTYYTGLYDTQATLGQYNCISVQEYVIRPDIPLQTLMNAIAIAGTSILIKVVSPPHFF